MTLLMARLCEVFLPPLTDLVEKKTAAIQTRTVALIEIKIMSLGSLALNTVGLCVC